MRSTSRKRDEKGITKTKIATREASANSINREKNNLDDKNDTLRKK